jgi:hypothetical protein
MGAPPSVKQGEGSSRPGGLYARKRELDSSSSDHEHAPLTNVSNSADLVGRPLGLKKPGRLKLRRTATNSGASQSSSSMMLEDQNAPPIPDDLLADLHADPSLGEIGHGAEEHKFMCDDDVDIQPHHAPSNQAARNASHGLGTARTSKDVNLSMSEAIVHEDHGHHASLAPPPSPCIPPSASSSSGLKMDSKAYCNQDETDRIDATDDEDDYHDDDDAVRDTHQRDGFRESTTTKHTHDQENSTTDKSLKPTAEILRPRDHVHVQPKGHASQNATREVLSQEHGWNSPRSEAIQPSESDNAGLTAVDVDVDFDVEDTGTQTWTCFVCSAEMSGSSLEERTRHVEACLHENVSGAERRIIFALLACVDRYIFVWMYGCGCGWVLA